MLIFTGMAMEFRRGHRAEINSTIDTRSINTSFKTPAASTSRHNPLGINTFPSSPPPPLSRRPIPFKTKFLPPIQRIVNLLQRPRLIHIPRGDISIPERRPFRQMPQGQSIVGISIMFGVMAQDPPAILRPNVGGIPFCLLGPVWVDEMALVDEAYELAA